LGSFWAGVDFISLLPKSKLALGPIQPTSYQVSKDAALGVTQPEQEADHSHPIYIA